MKIVTTKHAQHFFDKNMLPVEIFCDEDEWTVRPNLLFDIDIDLFYIIAVYNARHGRAWKIPYSTLN